MSDRWVSTKEAGKQLGFKPRTISRWCREGKIPARKVGRVWRIRSSGLFPK